MIRSDLISIYRSRQNILYPILKRAMDILGAVFGIIFFLPVFLVIAVLIKMNSHGPVFYIQKRCGQGGREFGMYKFRSMINGADSLKPQLKNEVLGSVFKVKNDSRVTGVGRFIRCASLDELPQVFNILKGEMSLVGPRPLADEEMSYDKRWKELRLTVKPGLTGLWQVKGRGERSFDNWVKYDTEYVMNQSLSLDSKILLMTFGAVIKGKGAY